jgi:hypothetical protein
VLPGPLLAKYQADEHLDPDVFVSGPAGPQRVKVDWPLVEAWRDAVGALRENADAQLPNSGRCD